MQDMEEESMSSKKVHTRVGSGPKRRRAAEVHNLSERVSDAFGLY